jgi:hypothetical protein
MTDPVPDRRPGEPRPDEEMRREPKDHQRGDGCFGVMLILLGLPLVLLGLFLGLCAVSASLPVLLMISIVPLGLGIWFLTLAHKVLR